MFLDGPRLACRNFAKRCSAGSCIQLYSAVLLQISSFWSLKGHLFKMFRYVEVRSDIFKNGPVTSLPFHVCDIEDLR